METARTMHANSVNTAILVDTTDISELTEPIRPPVREHFNHPFLDWKLDELVDFAQPFDRSAHGIIDTEFVILDEQTLEDKTFALFTPSEVSEDIENASRLTARSDF